MHWQIEKKKNQNQNNCDGSTDAEACGHLQRVYLCERAPKTLKHAAKYLGEPFPAHGPAASATVLAERGQCSHTGLQQPDVATPFPRWEAIPCPKLAGQAQKGDQKGKLYHLGLPSTSPALQSEQGSAEV